LLPKPQNPVEIERLIQLLSKPTRFNFSRAAFKLAKLTGFLRTYEKRLSLFSTIGAPVTATIMLRLSMALICLAASYPFMIGMSRSMKMHSKKGLSLFSFRVITFYALITVVGL